jgi:alpha-D-ribose 1-methylphosphonate 5-triphosphate synthase subunit PhnH
MGLAVYQIGTAEYPDRSATLIVECAELAQSGATLAGPGIKDTVQLKLPDLESFQANSLRYPLGLDFFFTSGTQVAALPRSTQIAEG